MIEQGKLARAALKDKVQNALDEARMLILGSQVLLGFQFRAAFEPGFERLPGHTQLFGVASLGLLAVTICLLMWPGVFHQIVEKGQDTRRMHRFTTGVTEAALLPFAIALSIQVFGATERSIGIPGAMLSGCVTLIVALGFWYGIEELARRRQFEKAMRHEGSNNMQYDEGTELRDKIKQVLTEARVVLPGAQALLGFQFATILMDAFEALPRSSKTVHLISLALVALSTIFLMTPAAYHRIVERGENSDHFHRFSGRMLIAAMSVLALGIAGDLFVAVRKVAGSFWVGFLCALLSAGMFYGLWFGYTTYVRMRDKYP